MPRSIADGSTAAPSRSVGVITYLAQDRHSSYGRDSLGMLKRSVRSLFKYYNARAKDDEARATDAGQPCPRRGPRGTCEALRDARKGSQSHAQKSQRRAQRRQNPSARRQAPKTRNGAVVVYDAPSDTRKAPRDTRKGLRDTHSVVIRARTENK